MIRPPGNSVDLDQGSRVAEPGADLVSGLSLLLDRIREELDYSDAKGSSPFRLGMHDGLRFSEDAIVDLLQRHGHDFRARATELDA